MSDYASSSPRILPIEHEMLVAGMLQMSSESMIWTPGEWR